MKKAILSFVACFLMASMALSQNWLATKIGKSYNMVNAYVQNRQQPRLEVLNDIANILDIAVKDLIVSSKKRTKIQNK